MAAVPIVTEPPGAIVWSEPALATACGVQPPEQAGRVPQAMPWALKASQPLGVPLARLPSSSSAAR